MPGREPGAERLPGRAAQREADRSRRQARARRGAVVTAFESRPPTVRFAVRDRELGLGRHAVVDRLARRLDQLPVERVVERRRLRLACAGAARRPLGVVQDRREVDAAVPPLRERGVDVEQVDAADEIVEPRDAELRHDPPRLLGDEEEEVDDVLGLAGELLAQLRILRRDPDRARVQVAGAHHHAAGRDQRRGREAHLVGAEQRRDRRRRGRS